MKKLFAVVLALVVGVLVNPIASATLTNSNSYSQYGNVLFYSALITAASNDTTANADSNVISNLDGSIKDICVGVRATNQTGTSPTLTLKLLGADNASGPFYVMTGAQDQDDPGTLADMDSAALDINTASSTSVATGICSSQFGRTNLPPYLKVRVTVGGSSTPGWTGVATAAVKR